ncbi:putative transcriptional regulatory protein [Fusarium oxysporum f. sp. albedinis]|nr:putative transcriptional regulatory protein [Fusarium oxysporum f. sp. albedinis]
MPKQRNKKDTETQESKKMNKWDPREMENQNYIPIPSKDNESTNDADDQITVSRAEMMRCVKHAHIY